MKKPMKKFAGPVFAVLMVAVAASFLPSSAEAAPKFKATLSASTRFTCFSSPNANVVIQSMEGVPYCFKTNTDGGAALCTQDFKPVEQPVTGTLLDGGTAGLSSADTMVATTTGAHLTFGPFPMGPDLCVAAKGLDGGDPRVNVFYLTGNSPEGAAVALTIVKADVTQVAPELASRTDLDSTMWTLLIGWAALEIGSNVGNQAAMDRAGRFLVAHMATLWPNQYGAGGNGGPGFSSGPVTSTKVGEVSVASTPSLAWTKLAITAAALATTAYGREFLRLIRLGIGPVVGLAN